MDPKSVSAAKLIAAKASEPAVVSASLAAELRALFKHNDALPPSNNRRVGRREAQTLLVAHGMPAHSLDAVCRELGRRSWVLK